MTVPNTFANATTAIPLVQLDQNFNTGVTLGNTTVFLGNTTTSFGNVTLNAPTFTTAALGTPASGNLTNCTGVTITARTRQVFLTGTAATYTTPANCKQQVIRMWGAGGGGAGTGTTGPNLGGTGSDTLFNSIAATGGSGGGNGVGGAGGTAAIGSRSMARPGNVGGTCFNASTATTVSERGGTGGGAGGLGGNEAAAGSAAAANSGGGGGGGGIGAVVFASFGNYYQAGGGGQGEYCEIIINTPAATYTYTVGAGGTAGAAGTSGYAGGAGGSGYIVVDEYY